MRAWRLTRQQSLLICRMTKIYHMIKKEDAGLLVILFFIIFYFKSSDYFALARYTKCKKEAIYLNPIDTGTKISSLRKERNMTQKDLADKLHVTDKAVSKWERGLNYPDLSILPALAKVLDTSVAEILGLEQNVSDSTIDVISEISNQEKKMMLKILRDYLFLTIILGIGVLIFKLYVFYYGYVWEKYNFVFWIEGILIGLSLTLITNGIRLLRKWIHLL